MINSLKSKKIIINILLCGLAITNLGAQHATNLTEETAGKTKHKHRDISAFGFGVGQDYGGFGVNVTMYPQKNTGIFASAGYAIAGVGYNAGLKFRIIPKTKYLSVSPFITAMYGYNAAIKVKNNIDLSKLFYGPTVGGGFDFRGSRNRGYFTLGILVPIRDDEVAQYREFLEKAYKVRFNAELLPVTISIGYRKVLK